MNYEKIYNLIIKKAENRGKLTNECEIHHILPRSLGGSNHVDNLVTLTYKEHYVCHRLLTYIYPNLKEMHFAFWMMSNRFKNSIRITASTYRLCKINYIKHRSGVPLSAEVKLKISISKKNNPCFFWVGRNHTEESKEKMRISALNRNISEENEAIRRKKISEAHLGKPLSENHKKNLSDSKKGDKNPMFGKFGKDHAKSKKIYQYDMKGDFIREWENAKIASKELNISYSGIRNCVNNVTKSSGKFIWTEIYIN